MKTHSPVCPGLWLLLSIAAHLAARSTDYVGTLDQSVTPTTIVSGFIVEKSQTLGQSFTVGRYGILTDVEILVGRNPVPPRAKAGKVQLTWTPAASHHYNIYRGMNAGGPYLKIASTTSTYCTYLDETVTNNSVYYYVVRQANPLDQEFCQSNEAVGRPRAR